MLEIELFRFDKNIDFVRYYKPYEFDIINFASLRQLFELIKQDDPYFEFNGAKFVKIQNICVNIDENIQNILNKFGNLLRIEPVDTFRVYKDLLIDNSDFTDIFKLFAPFCDKDDEKLYLSLENFYYAYPIRALKPDFIGDSAFIFANKMIEKYPQKKAQFLKIITNSHNGIFYHLNLQNYIFSTEIKLENIVKSLFDMALELNLIDFTPLKIDINFKIANANQICATELKNFKFKLNNFNVATYGDDAILKFTKMLAANNIAYEMSNISSLFTLFCHDCEFAYKIAGEILLDAIDCGADFMVVNDAFSFYLFDTCAQKLQECVNRKFNDFYVLSLNELYEICIGNDTHSIKRHNLKVWLI